MIGEVEHDGSDYCSCSNNRRSILSSDKDEPDGVNDMIYSYYEGGEQVNQTRFDKLYGDDVSKFNVKDAS